MIRASLCALALMTVPSMAQERVQTGSGVVLRVLDKLTGNVADMTIPNGATGRFGRILVSLQECRYPDGNPTGDAYAFVTVTEFNADIAAFSGWVIASSPALNPMDHPRYDVWPLRCTTS